MNPELKKDKWALKAIEYLCRRGYSTEQIIEAIAEYGIREGKIGDLKDYD
jgi:SOS response regulatory protein OraA/RecX